MVGIGGAGSKIANLLIRVFSDVSRFTLRDNLIIDKPKINFVSIFEIQSSFNASKSREFLNNSAHTFRMVSE